MRYILGRRSGEFDYCYVRELDLGRDLVGYVRNMGDAYRFRNEADALVVCEVINELLAREARLGEWVAELSSEVANERLDDEIESRLATLRSGEVAVTGDYVIDEVDSLTDREICGVCEFSGYGAVEVISIN